MSSVADSQMTREQRRQQEREERRRKRTAAQESAKQPASAKTPAKDYKKTRRDLTNGSAKKPLGNTTKRPTVRVYDKVNVIEKTAKFDNVEKENKRKPKTEQVTKTDAARKKLGSKFMDNLSKFESHTKEKEAKKSSFVRSHNGQSTKSTSSAAADNDPTFRRSYRTSRTTPIIDDPTILNRRSLRKERVLDSIAKLERKTSNEEEASDSAPTKKKSSSPPRSRGSSQTSSASSSRTSLSDSSGGTSKSLSRAQQALERHKLRIRSSSQTSQNGGAVSPGKPSSPVTKTPVMKKTSKSKQEVKEKESPKNSSEKETKKLSVATEPVEGDVVEVTTVTEITSPTEGKMSIVVKEIAQNEEETEKLLSPVEGKEYELGDPRPMSVEETVAAFSRGESSPEKPGSPSADKPKKTKHKLPSFPPEDPTSEPTVQTEEQHSPQAGSNKSPLRMKEQDVVIIETSPAFQENSDTLKTPDSGSSANNLHFTYNFNQNSNLEPEKENLLLLERDYKDPATVENDPARPPESTNVAEVKSEKTFSAEEAINRLQQLSDEVNSSGDDKTLATEEPQNDPVKVDETELSKTSEAEKRPSSLRIEEVLYVEEEEAKSQPRKNSPSKAEKEEFKKPTSSPTKSPAEPHRPLSYTKSGTLSDGGRTSPLKLRKSSTELSSIETPSSGGSSPTRSRRLELSSSETPSSGDSSPTKTRKPVLELSSSETPSSGSSASSPVKLKRQQFELYSSQAPSSGESSSTKSAAFHTSEVPSSRSRSISPVKSPKSLPRTPESPSISQNIPVSPKSPVSKKISISPARSPTKNIETVVSDRDSTSSLNKETTAKSTVTETSRHSSKPSTSPVRTPSPQKTPLSSEPADDPPVFESEPEPIESPTKESKLESKVVETSRRSSKSSSSSVRTPSPKKRSPSPKKSSSSQAEESVKPAEEPKKTEIIENSTEKASQQKPVLPEVTKKSVPNEIKSPASSQKSETTTENEMLKSYTPRYKKSWLDESDDDNISVLSDAPSDASSIDLDWLGPDSDNDDYVPKKSAKTNKGSTSVQRSSSSAQDMLKMWEKKAQKPDPAKKKAPVIIAGDSAKRVGSVKAAWESGVRDSSSESIENGHSSPTGTPKRQASLQGSPMRTPSQNSLSSKGSQEEMKDRQEIFGDLKASGKIEGAKAMFETLSQSPKKSPLRSPKRRPEPRSESSQDADSSQKSPDSPDSQTSDGPDDSPRVDNMRAMFESQGNKKNDVKRQKTSLAEMVADDERDVTDVSSIKAMWESMDNRR